MFEAKDAQLTASFSLKSRSTLTIKEVINKDCSELLNPESIHQLILVDLNGEESVSTPPNPPSPQANPIPSHATPLEQPPQPEDNTAQPQNNMILLPTPSSTSPKSNITSPKPHSRSLLPLTPFHPTSLGTGTKAPTNHNSHPPQIIGAASFAQIIWEGAQAYQLHVSPSLPEKHL
ncbi:hypothetical protein C0995_006093 [Termitomyces sp. Mi166|nr:hypothetical protein C0995_006093 [Termitomyces sp. Mi166\